MAQGNMDFVEQLKEFSARVESIKDAISTEEATKTSIIMPFFSMLGYDVFNPQEFVPEFTADVGIKKGEKVDYAIMLDNQPAILIEAKAIGRKLDKHDSQLFRYFAASSAKFAILTNGIQYRFYTDLDESNKMDAIPFFTFNLLNFRPEQMVELCYFQKSNFNADKIYASASDLRYIADFKNLLRAQFEEPSEEFVRFCLQDIYSGMKTQAVINRFRPILQKAASSLLHDLCNEQHGVQPTMPSPTVQAKIIPSSPERHKIEAIPSENEALALHILKEMSADYVNTDIIDCKKNDSYFVACINGSSRKWIYRIIEKGSSLTLVLPDANKSDMQLRIANPYELWNYRNYIIHVIARFTSLQKQPPVCNGNIYQVDLIRHRPRKRSL